MARRRLQGRAQYFTFRSGLSLAVWAGPARGGAVAFGLAHRRDWRLGACKLHSRMESLCFLGPVCRCRRPRRPPAVPLSGLPPGPLQREGAGLWSWACLWIRSTGCN